MHPLQAKFIDAIVAFRSGPMTEALIRLVETYGAVKCSNETREELRWYCRETLSKLEVGWDAHTTLDIPEFPVSICFHVMVARLQRGEPPVGMQVQMFVAMTMPQELQARWEALGFTEEPIFIERAAIRFPIPLAGEAGYHPDYWRTRPNIHRPNDRTELASELRYAYALSVEADGSSEWLRRYHAGEREQVWAEMTALGDRARDPAMLPHAVAVARETMRRYRANVEALHRSLSRAGFPFEKPEAAFVAPGADVLKQIAWLEAEAGPLPLSLCAWYELVGSVNFNPNPDARLEHPSYPDPLWVYPIEAALADEGAWYRNRYRICIAPDFYHKANVSGGLPYTIYTPDAGADATLHYEPHCTTFVDYLRLAFQANGFPGLSPHDQWLLPEDVPSLLPI